MILVTGATGILGRMIVLELLKRGFDVKATKRPSSDIEEVKHSYDAYTDRTEEFFNKIQWVDVDFDDVYGLEYILKEVTEVYHCAAMVSFNPKSRKALFHTNVEGTKNLLYACESSKVKKFCFISSIAVLDGFNENGEQDEDSDFKPVLDHSIYAESKHFSEMEVWRAFFEGLNTVIVNPGVIIGSGNWQRSSGQLFRTLERVPYTFSGSSAYVDVRDVANIAVDLMKNNIFGERFLAVAENCTFREVATQVRSRLGLSVPKVIPDRLLQCMGIFSILGFLFPALKLLNKVNIQALVSSSKISNKKIKDRLGYQFIPVKESINFHMDNYIKDKNLKR
ncbi:NAD-dependent epimerase/dehydratase family protein [Elizabethkingia argentiflava]|uniref:NAD-dependent epimerase/dehydratase family protein n=1 Tax=Elizabethkingia argenteiflava TaxID=2681556 RepID=A0A845PUU4_9FLAO|nr:NAD-dependent epimerase/dehydratase family protein [Elizabethkingia argenteiflava]NAW50247.1 NAD-dependent epimerase/dehydratase family protein [Elizabethkingia argenteiflava]